MLLGNLVENIGFLSGLTQLCLSENSLKGSRFIIAYCVCMYAFLPSVNRSAVLMLSCMLSFETSFYFDFP